MICIKKKSTLSQKRKIWRENSRKWRKEHPGYNARLSKEWRKKNKAKHYAATLAWKKKNPEKAKILWRRATRAWNSRNPNHAHEYYMHNREKLIKQNSEYIKANPEKNAAKYHKRKARVLGNGGEFTAQQWINLKHQCGNRCLCCHKRERELLKMGRKLVPDHVISLSKGGSNDISNIQPLCHGRGGCNNKKGVKCVDYRPAPDCVGERKKRVECR